MEITFSLPGVALFNCVIVAYGLILMYNILPETESRTLEDIEMHFADNSKKLTDHKIPKKTKIATGEEGRPSETSTRSVSFVGIEDMNKNHAGNGFANPSFVGDDIQHDQHTKF